jgi:transposase
MAQKKREEKLMKAEVSLRNDAYGIKKGSQEYIREEVENPESGELEAAHKRVIRSVDLEKAQKDAFYDGYFCLVTSELDYDAARIREVYGGLWKIEASFSVLKSDLDARPVHVWTQEHIRAHFLICFVALLIVRLLQHALGDKTLSAERIARAFNAATCKVKRGGIVELDDVGGRVAFEKKPNKKGELVETLRFIEEDEVARDFARIQEVFQTSLELVEVKQERFNRILSSIALEL